MPTCQLIKFSTRPYFLPYQEASFCNAGGEVNKLFVLFTVIYSYSHILYYAYLYILPWFNNGKCGKLTASKRKIFENSKAPTTFRGVRLSNNT